MLWPPVNSTRRRTLAYGIPDSKNRAVALGKQRREVRDTRRRALAHGIHDSGKTVSHGNGSRARVEIKREYKDVVDG